MSPLASIALVLVLLAPLAAADTLKVPSAAYPTIQSAVDDAQEGDVVKVRKGLYLENVVVQSAGVTLLGKGAVIDGGYLGPCIEVAAHDVRVAGFTLVNGFGGVVSTEPAEGFVPQRTTVEGCTMRSCGTGVALVGYELTIRGNLVEQCTTGIALVDAGGLVGSLVSGNTVQGGIGTGIDAQGGSFRIERNVVRQQNHGIRVVIDGLAEGTSPPPPSFVVRNRCEDTDGDGIQVFDIFATGAVLEGNRCTGNGQHGFLLGGGNMLVRDNRAERNGGPGFGLGSFFDPLYAAEVVDNLSRDNRQEGFILTHGDPLEGQADVSSLLSGNRALGNAWDGIRVRQGDGTRLLGNVCKGNGGDGIDVDVGVSDVVIDDNVCRANAHEGLDNGGSDSLVRGNVLRKNRRGLGPDFAGAGDGGQGSVASAEGNVFDTGGDDVPSQLDTDAILN